MAKVILYKNYRVEVVPYFGIFCKNKSHDDKFRDCEELVRSIKRHIDDIESIGTCYDIQEVCEFCGSTWENPPACCEKAVAELETPAS